MLTNQSSLADNQPSAASSTGLFIGLAIAVVIVAVTGSMATGAGVHDWYPRLDRPPWTPPNWMFGPVWTFLYASMTVAGWDAIRRAPATDRLPAALTATQLVLNALWSPVFFALHWLWAGSLLLTGLWLTLAACIVVYARSSRLAAGLMVPYLAWISVAWSLNAWIAWFNP